MTGPALHDDVADVRVLRGDPTPDELAALVAVLTARAATGGAASAAAMAPRPSRWATYWRKAGVVPSPGMGAWRSSVR